MGLDRWRVALLVLVAGIGLAQRGEQTAAPEDEHPLLEQPNLASPTSSPASEEPRAFYFTVPDVVGLPLQKAKGALREAFVNAHSQDQSVSFQYAFDPQVVFRVSKRETNKAEPGTVLQMRNLPTGGSGDIEGSFTIPDDIQSGERVRSVIKLVVATRPIQFPGDSIYIDGVGSAMVTWLDSNLNIHQKTVALPAWFGVPVGVENYSAQKQSGDSSAIVCQLRYDDKVYAHSRSSGPYAICSASS
jgi:hypothetical protein